MFLVIYFDRSQSYTNKISLNLNTVHNHTKRSRNFVFYSYMIKAYMPIIQITFILIGLCKPVKCFIYFILLSFHLYIIHNFLYKKNQCFPRSKNKIYYSFLAPSIMYWSKQSNHGRERCSTVGVAFDLIALVKCSRGVGAHTMLL